MKSSLLKKVVVGTFLSVPAVSSIISTIHLVDLFNMGNPTWLSILLAVTFELGSIASLLAISVIERIKVGAIWFIFFILSALQILGNVYYSYNFTSNALLSNPTFLTNFMDLFSPIIGEELKDAKIFLACIIGIPIPLIALFFLKSNIDYLKPEKGQEKIKSSNNEIVGTVKDEEHMDITNEESFVSNEKQETNKDEISSDPEDLHDEPVTNENLIESNLHQESIQEENIQQENTQKKNYKVRTIGNNIIKY
jgi:hypothetical protein